MGKALEEEELARKKAEEEELAKKKAAEEQEVKLPNQDLPATDDTKLVTPDVQQSTAEGVVGDAQSVEIEQKPLPAVPAMPVEAEVPAVPVGTEVPAQDGVGETPNPVSEAVEDKGGDGAVGGVAQSP